MHDSGRISIKRVVVEVFLRCLDLYELPTTLLSDYSREGLFERDVSALLFTENLPSKKSLLQARPGSDGKSVRVHHDPDLA